MTAKYLTIRSTSQYLGVPVASAVAILRARIPWVTHAKPIGCCAKFSFVRGALNRQP